MPFWGYTSHFQTHPTLFFLKFHWNIPLNTSSYSHFLAKLPNLRCFTHMGLFEHGVCWEMLYDVLPSIHGHSPKNGKQRYHFWSHIFSIIFRQPPGTTGWSSSAPCSSWRGLSGCSTSWCGGWSRWRPPRAGTWQGGGSRWGQWERWVVWIDG